MRQTTLDFDQIMKLFPVSGKCAGGCCDAVLPSGLLVNEVGELAKEGDERAFDQLVEWLKAKDANIRYIACGWLHECGDTRALEAVRELLKSEKDQRVMEMAEKAKDRLEIILGWTARN